MARPSLLHTAKSVMHRIAQETFNNVTKHADATRVWVTLRSEAGTLFLTVRDNGRGFEPAAIPTIIWGYESWPSAPSPSALGCASPARPGTEPRYRSTNMTWFSLPSSVYHEYHL